MTNTTQTQTISTDELDAFIAREDFDPKADHLEYTGAFMAEHGFEGVGFDYSTGIRTSVTAVALPGVTDDMAFAGYAALMRASGNTNAALRLDVPGALIFARPVSSGWLVALPSGYLTTVPTIAVAFDVAENDAA